MSCGRASLINGASSNHRREKVRYIAPASPVRAYSATPQLVTTKWGASQAKRMPSAESERVYTSNCMHPPPLLDLSEMVTPSLYADTVLSQPTSCKMSLNVSNFSNSDSRADAYRRGDRGHHRWTERAMMNGIYM